MINIAAGQKYNAKAINERHRDNAMFVGYAPHHKPEIVVAVVVENAGGGGSNAAPVARLMMDHYFTTDAEKPALPTLAEIALQQEQRTAQMLVREARYAEEKAAEDRRKAKLKELKNSQSEPAPAQPKTETPAAAEVQPNDNTAVQLKKPAEENGIDD